MKNKNENSLHFKNAVFTKLLSISFFTYFMLASVSPLAPCAKPLPIPDTDAAIELIEPVPEAVLEVETPPCSLGIDEKVCQYYEIIVSAAIRHEVETPLVMAIIQTESRYNPKALSPKGAQGLMQLMPRTAESLGVEDAFDPEQNIDAGVRYFKKMLKKVKGDHELALAAYNAGFRNVQQYGGIPPFPETLDYVRKVQSWYDHYKGM
jgi:hypothetical protein